MISEAQIKVTCCAGQYSWLTLSVEQILSPAGKKTGIGIGMYVSSELGKQKPHSIVLKNELLKLTESESGLKNEWNQTKSKGTCNGNPVSVDTTE